MMGQRMKRMICLCVSGLMAQMASASVILQLDANDLSGSLNDGDAVAAWGPLSQGTVVNQPTFRSGGMNGMPSVDFDGADDFLTGGTLNGAVSIVAVTLYEGSISLATLLSNDNDQQQIRRNNATDFYRSVGQGGDNNEFYRHGNHVGQDNAYVDAVGSGSFTSGASHVVLSNAGAPANFNNLTLGRATGSGGAAGRLWDGDVAEVYFFDQTLTQDEITGVSSILADRWGSAAIAATPGQIRAGNTVLGIIPEPHSFGLVVFGCGLLAAVARRRKHQN